MKLKDKFDSTIMRHDLGRNELEETKEQCVEIAEEFAIGFLQWFICYYTGKAFYEKKYIKELLEIYKKEKGL